MPANDPFLPEPVAGDAQAEAAPAGVGPGGEAASGRAPEAPADVSVAAAIDRQGALRALRSLEATEARLERAAKRDLEDARGKLVQELLPVLDNLDRTIRAAHVDRSNRSDPAMLEGVRLVRHQLEGVLRGYGVERVDAIDQPFDPGLHEAIGVTAVGDPRRHGLVVHQAEPGYRLAGKLLRPAKVNVGKFVAQADVVHRPLWR